MPKQESEQGLNALTISQTIAYGICLAAGLAALSQPFTSYGCGKKYYGWNVALAFLLLVGWMSLNAPHEKVLLQFCVVWLFMVAVQSLSARWNHAFGVRELTRFAGYPLVIKLLPLPVHFSRQVVTPLYLFGLGCLIDDKPLSVLIRSSALGQAALFAFVALRSAQEEDELSDVSLRIRSRSR